MNKPALKILVGLSLVLLPWRIPARADDLADLIRSWGPVVSTTGNEQALATRVAAALPTGLKVEKDPFGSFFVRSGDGAPGLAVFAALDGYGWLVSGIMADGTLTLDRPGRPPHPGFDTFLLGSPVVVVTRQGHLQAVVAQPAMHLLTAERRRTLLENFSLESAFVDIGVRSAEEARAKGVEILDAVHLRPDLTELAGGRWAGPALGIKAAAAVLAEAVKNASAMMAKGTAAGWLAQTKFPVRGRARTTSLGAVRARTGLRPGAVILVDLIAADKAPAGPALGGGPVLVQAVDEETPFRTAVEETARRAGISLQRAVTADSPLLAAFQDGASALALALPVRYLHSPAETVDLKDAEALTTLLVRLLQQGGGK
ncbi:MAG: hypothetical protein OEW05_13870 [Candidatus Aminicenantes bacterium]|nr:hypothetical protein [Candidatus Aminicenantes bacterium]